ncbi:MAG: flagellar motor switch protein FliG, partial [Alphaproteobacteria bacterium]|jgi:flagellar motor switch protein FliG|nr:flagellar motor switch protein FliG [Alphaproteobacteria bacterium]MBT7942179.1 flagellar motor switch protein FliG [Alphaproteobacteria bacterium]
MARLKDDYRSLSGPQKAGMFMLSIGPEQSGALFERMDDEEIRELSQAMSSLGAMSSNMVERLFVEFADQLSSAGGLVGSYTTTERLLTGALDEERVNAIMEEMRGPAGRTMWDKLGNVNESVLANYLRNEYPQTVAVVLSKIKTDHAARVLGVLPENFSLEVIMRMLRMEAVQKDILDHVERTLRSEFMTNLASATRRDSHEHMADIFNNLDRNTETRFMTALDERNRESAERIRQLMFTFDDLVRMDAAGIQVLLRQVEKDQLALGLKGAADDVKDLFFSNMSERAGKMMREDMEAMGAVRLKDVDEAQAVIVTTAKALADSGEIVISSGDEEGELIY